MKAGHQLYKGGLKFVRWDYLARNHRELTVQIGNEVEILRMGSRDTLYKVKLVKDGRTGQIPEKCFYPRTKVTFTHKPDCEGGFSVNEGDVIGIIENSVEGNNMCKIMKDDGVEGYIPQHCLYRSFEVCADHKGRENENELSVTSGETVGLVEDDSLGEYWEVYHKGKIGHIPRKCLEPPAQVHCDYEATTDDDISVKKGNEVTLVDHHHGNVEGMPRVKVRLGDKVGFIPRKCLEFPAKAFRSRVSSLTPMAKTFLEKCTKKNDLNEIARHTFDWEEHTLLGLTDVEIQSVKAKHPEKYEMQCFEALQKWKDNEGSEATYGNLLKIFVETGYKTVANSICTILEKKCKS